MSSRRKNENQYRIAFTGYLWRFEFFAGRNVQETLLAFTENYECERRCYNEIGNDGSTFSKFDETLVMNW